MAVETYTVQYIADASVFTSGGHKVEQLVRSIDAAVTTSKTNMKGMFGGAGRSATAAAKNIDKLNQSLGAVPAAATSARSSVQGFTGASTKAAKSSGDMFANLDLMVAKLASLATAYKVATAAIQIYSKASEDAKKHMNEGADTGLGMRAKSREYATLMGKNSVDDEVMNRLFALGQTSGSKIEDAREYGEAFLGSVTTGRDAKHITPDQEKILEQQGLLFGNRVGLDQETAGRLAGSISQYVDLTKDDQGNPLTTQQGVDKQMGQYNAIHYGLNEGVGKVSVLARNELGATSAALGTGHMKDHADVAAFAGIASTIGKGASATGNKFNQMDKLINESQGDEGEWLRSIGVADQKGDLEKLRVLKAHIDAQRRAAQDPSKFDAGQYLMSKGFGSDEEVKATVGFLGNFDVLELRTKNARKRANDGQAALKANQEFLTSLDGQAGQGQAIREAGNYAQTLPRQRLAAARNAAYGQLMAEKQIDTVGTNLADGFLDGTINKLQPNTGHEARIDQRVWENFRSASKKAGIEGDVRAKDPLFLDIGGPKQMAGPNGVVYSTRQGYGGQDPAKLDEALNTFGPEIERRQVPINGPTIPAQTNGAAAPAPAAGAAGQAGQPGVAGAAAPGVAPKVASVDASQLDKASDKLDKATDKLASVLDKFRGSPGSHLGGSYGPYRA